MMVCVTGTPGTGKSGVCGRLAQMGHASLPLDLAVEHFGLGEGSDPVEVDEERLSRLGTDDPRAFARSLMGLALGMDGTADVPPNPLGSPETHLFVDGHLSHYLNPASVDLVAVLRRHPGDLRPLLEERGYAPEKVRENLEAESIDIIGQEAAPLHGRVVEFDGTDCDVDALARAVLGATLALNSDDPEAASARGGEGSIPQPRKPGEIDFSEAILDMY